MDNETDTDKKEKVKIKISNNYLTDTSSVKVNEQVIAETTKRVATLFVEGLKKTFDALHIEYESEEDYMFSGPYSHGDYGWMD